MKIISHVFLLLIICCFFEVKAQAPVACFSAASGQSFPITQCGPFFLPLTNCSTGTYDSVVWEMQISSSFGCNGPWGLTFLTTKVGALAHTNTGYSLTVAGSYKVCLYIFNRQTGARDSTCTCVAISYPFPVLNFAASDTLNCGNLTTIFTPNIVSGTAPYGPINWFFGDNTTATTSGATPITHSYTCKTTSPPCYTITMSATDAHGCSKVITKPCYINVPCAPHPTALVTGGSLCTLPATVNFSVSATPLIGTGIYKIWFPPLNAPPAAPLIGPTSQSTFSHTYNNYGCYNLIVEVTDSLSGCKGKDTLVNAVCLQTIVVDSLVSHTPKICCGQAFNIKLVAHYNPNLNQPCIISGALVATPVGGGASIQLPGITANSNQYITMPCGTITTPTTYNICFAGGLIGNSCNNCTTNFSGCVQVTVYPTPTANIMQSVIDTVHCSTLHNFCFQANQAPTNTGCLYSWYVNNPSGSPISYTTSACTSFANFGRQTVYLKVCQSATNGGCCSNDVVTMSQWKQFGDFSITQPPQSCGSSCATITIIGLATDTLYPQPDSAYIYLFGDGTAPFHSNLTTVTHCYTSTIDTCFKVKVIHITHSMGGAFCADTMANTGYVTIGHHVVPNANYFPLEQCLVKKDACFTVVPTQHINSKTNGNCTINCHWFFSQSGTLKPSAEIYSCDTAIVCISDIGQFDAHYQINNNGCIDTGFYVHNAVTVKGIIGSIGVKYSCNYTNGYCVQISPTYKIFPAQSAPTHIKVIIDQTPCGAPQVYNFNVSTGNQPNPINFCFCNTGTYKVTMISSNDSLHCPPDTVFQYISPIAYKAVLELNPTNTIHKQCNTKTWCFSSAHSKPGRPYNYDIVWDYGDGIKDTMLRGSVDTSLVRPCHTYANCGIYIIKLKIIGSCVDSAVDTITIREIKPNIFITPLSANCALCLIFHNNTIYCGDTADSTYLYLGNSTFKTYKGNWTLDTICYNVPPNSNAFYKLFSKGKCYADGYISTPNIIGVHACASPLPDTVVCQGKTITFNNCSGGFVTNACWKVDNVACNQSATCTSNVLGNFNYTFSNLGYYYLNLQVSNFYGCVDDTCIRIHVANPHANFFGRDTLSCPGIFDSLVNLSTGAYDKITVTMSSAPLHFFTSFVYSINDPGGLPKKVGIPIGYPGDYVICWKITSITGCADSICKTLHVQGPLGHLACSNVYGCLGDTICCALNTNSVLSPIIQYPDGTFDLLNHNSSGVYNFCHAYNVLGHKLVQATIDDGIGCSYPLSDTVHIDGAIADFTWTPHITDFCNKADVIMNDLSIKGIYDLDTTKYKWIIKNSSGNVFAIYSHQSPHVIITTPGSYTMMLIVKTIFGCVDTVEKPFVKVHSNPLAQFISSPDTICVNDCVSFANTSINTDPAKNYTWFFDWNNPTPIAHTFNAQYCYTIPGNYNVVLLDSSIYNCIDTSSKHLVVVLSGINISFTQDKDTVCGNGTNVHFNSTTSPSVGVTQQWFFGDGTSTPAGNFLQVNHSYILPPTKADTCYQVLLIVRTISGCADSLTKQVCLAAVPQPALINNLAVSCSPLITLFSNNVLNNIPITNYTIDFGDGSANYNSTLPPNNFIKKYTNTSHTNMATYIANYTITSNFNCSASISDSFKVYPLPVACVGNNDTVCPGVNALVGCPPLPGYHYHWFHPLKPNTFKPGPFVAQPSINIYQPDSFALAVSNQFGCFDTNRITVHVRPLIVPDAGHDTTVCYGDTIHLYAHGGEAYIWKNMTTNEIISTHADVYVAATDSTNYRLLILGKCNNDSTTIIHINIFKPKPYIIIDPDNAKIFAGQHYIIKPNTNAALLHWSPNYFINCDTCHVVDVSPDVNTTYHVITEDLHGCTDSTTFKIKVLCDKENSLFIPNGFEPKVNAKYENRFFYVQGKGIKELEFIRIYNRWGSEVYSREHIPINKPEVGWDGYFNGKPCTCDIYMYQMQVICADGTIFPISGNMTLIR
ncbi:MAG: hypothetical protein RJA07_1762 [Bacteroidota bacterium]